MSSDSQYVKSTKEGYHWNLYTYKPQGRPGYAMAVEGVLENVEGGAFQSFTYVMFKNRQVMVPVVGRMTVKNRNAALYALWCKMHEDKLIADTEELKPVA